MNFFGCLLSLLNGFIGFLFHLLLFLFFHHLFSTILDLIENFCNFLPLVSNYLSWWFIAIHRHLFLLLLIIVLKLFFTRLCIQWTIICRFIGLLVLIKFSLFLLLLEKFAHSLVLFIGSNISP